ncbi:MAG: MFS transporter, partial [Acidobacteriota bacterium]
MSDSPNLTGRLRAVASLVFLQMLPATLLTAAIRPMFANLHGGKEWAMHAFMSINMAGAALAVPFLGAYLDRVRRPRRLLAALAAIDALLIAIVTMPLPVWMVLGLRAVEGVAHVGGATILLAEAARLGRTKESGRAMGMAGAAIIFAIAVGNALGGFAVSFHWRAPYLLASMLFLIVASIAFFSQESVETQERERMTLTLSRSYRRLWFPLGVAFIERFAVGCIIVTFSLFAHKAHQLSDSAIGGLFAMLTFPFALSMYPISRFSNVLPRAAILAAGSVLYAAAIFLLGQAAASALPLVMIMGGIGAAMLFGPTLCYASTLVEQSHRSTAMAIINAAGCLGMVAGPMAAGVTSTIFASAENPLIGYKAVFAMAASAILLWLVAGARWLVLRFRKELIE